MVTSSSQKWDSFSNMALYLGLLGSISILTVIVFAPSSNYSGHKEQWS